MRNAGGLRLARSARLSNRKVPAGTAVRWIAGGESCAPEAAARLMPEPEGRGRAHIAQHALTMCALRLDLGGPAAARTGPAHREVAATLMLIAGPYESRGRLACVASVRYATSPRDGSHEGTRDAHQPLRRVWARYKISGETLESLASAEPTDDSHARRSLRGDSCRAPGSQL